MMIATEITTISSSKPKLIPDLDVDFSFGKMFGIDKSQEDPSEDREIIFKIRNIDQTLKEHMEEREEKKGIGRCRLASRYCFGGNKTPGDSPSADESRIIVGSAGPYSS